jgi:hypothetical protein
MHRVDAFGEPRERTRYAADFVVDLVGAILASPTASRPRNPVFSAATPSIAREASTPMALRRVVQRPVPHPTSTARRGRRRRIHGSSARSSSATMGDGLASQVSAQSA